MAVEPSDVVREWFAGLARGELSPELCHPDFVTRNWDEAPIRGPYHGLDGLQHWWHDFAEVFDDVRLELKKVTPVDGERFVTVQHVVGRFRLTGIPVDGPFAAIVTVRDGKVLSAIGYASERRAMRAAGLAN